MVCAKDLNTPYFRKIKMNFKERKAERKKYYAENVYGWRERVCSACAGSGYYDHTSSPTCSACSGSGKELYKGTKNIK